ncbi:hypothetical protein pb186bvf_019031 [Paramecium bursaria]
MAYYFKSLLFILYIFGSRCILNSITFLSLFSIIDQCQQIQSQLCMKDGHNTNEIEYVCVYSQCKFSRFLCKQCKLEQNHQHDLNDNPHIIDKNAYDQQQQSSIQQIRNAKFQIKEVCNQPIILCGGISNDMRYIVIGGLDLKIWNYSTNNLIKVFDLRTRIYFVKFTDDSKFLYFMTYNRIYKLNVNKQFKLFHTYQISFYKGSLGGYENICIISNTQILITSPVGKLIKINTSQNKQIIKFKAHSLSITALNYDSNLNKIVTGSYNQSIKIWNDQGQLLINQKEIDKDDHNDEIFQVQFIVNNNQLISFDFTRAVIIWNINYKKRQLEQQLMLDKFNGTFQLVLQQQFIISICCQGIKVYSIDGEFIRLFDHKIERPNKITQYVIQPDSMKAILQSNHLQNSIRYMKEYTKYMKI